MIRRSLCAVVLAGLARILCAAGGEARLTPEAGAFLDNLRRLPATGKFVYSWTHPWRENDPSFRAEDGRGGWRARRPDEFSFPVYGHLGALSNEAPVMYFVDLNFVAGSYLGEAAYARNRASLRAMILKAWHDWRAVPVFSWHIENPYVPSGWKDPRCGEAPYRYRCASDGYPPERKCVFREILEGFGAPCGFGRSTRADPAAAVTTNANPRVWYEARLKEVADFIRTLRDGKGVAVPVTVRLFHECEDDWMWWGRGSATVAEYVAVFRYSVRRLRELTGGGRNVLFAYSPDRYWWRFGREGDNDPMSFMGRYPGDDSVDIIGYDDYLIGTDTNLEVTVARQNSALRMMRGISAEAKRRGKACGLFETGVIGAARPDAYDWIYRAMTTEDTAFAFVNLWGGYEIPRTDEGRACLKRFLDRPAVLTHRDGIDLTKSGSLPPARTPVLEVSKTHPRYFADADGRTFVPIGCNICFDRLYDGTADSRAACEARLHRRMRAFAANGGNYLRLWLGHPFFEVMPEKPGAFDPAATGTLLRTVRLAEELGIRLKLTLESFRRTEPLKPGETYLPIFVRPLYFPYAKDMPAFFKSDRCFEIYLEKARYLKRIGLGDSPAVACWELWNEINATGPVSRYEDWSARMLAALKRVFPRQMTTQNLGSFADAQAFRDYDCLARVADNDFMQAHRYLDPGAALDAARGPMDALCADAVTELLNRRPDRPAILAETGAVESCHTGPSLLYAKDREGTLLHDEIFAPFFAGSAGCGQPWHWDHQYIDRNGLWSHFRRFAKAVEGLDPVAERFEPFHTETHRLRVYGLRGRRTTVLWCRDKRATWRSELVDGKAAEVVSGERLPFESASGYDAYLPWEDRTVSLPPGRCALPDFTRSAVIRFASVGEP